MADIRARLEAIRRHLEAGGYHNREDFGDTSDWSAEAVIRFLLNELSDEHSAREAQEQKASELWMQIENDRDAYNYKLAEMVSRLSAAEEALKQISSICDLVPERSGDIIMRKNQGDFHKE